MNNSDYYTNDEGWTLVVSKKQRKADAKKRAKKRDTEERNRQIREKVPGWNPPNNE